MRKLLTVDTAAQARIELEAHEREWINLEHEIAKTDDERKIANLKQRQANLDALIDPLQEVVEAAAVPPSHDELVQAEAAAVRERIAQSRAVAEVQAIVESHTTEITDDDGKVVQADIDADALDADLKKLLSRDTTKENGGHDQ